MTVYKTKHRDNGHYSGPGHMSMLFYDHVVQGDTKQDYIAVASILESGFIRLRKDLPNVREVVLLSDNAGCYQNSILPIMVPFLARRNGLSLIKFMHTETQDGKSLVDAHFAIAMKHVSTYVSQGNDVTTPTGLVTALRANGGLSNSAVELVRINRSNEKLVAWEQLYNSDGQGLEWIRRNNEYSYEGWSECGTTVSVSCFRYSNMGDGRQCQFSRGGVCNPKTRTTVAFHASVNGDIVLDTPNDEEVIGIETGVLILSQRSISQLITKRIRKEVTKSSRFLTSATEERLISNEENNERNSSDEGGIHCANCQRPFTSEQRLSQHISFCKNNVDCESQSIVTRSLRICKDLMQSNDIKAHSTTDDIIMEHIDVSGVIIEDITSGWARRERQKPYYEGQNIVEYQEELQNLFDLGTADKAQKLSAAGMRQHLLQKYGERFDIPTDSDIQKAINVMFQRQKSSASQPSDTSLRRTRMSATYIETIDGINWKTITT